jgi:signal transduction histidine kinase
VGGSTPQFNNLEPAGALHYKYHQPMAALGVDLGHRLTWNAVWNYYQYAEGSFVGPTAPLLNCPKIMVDRVQLQQVFMNLMLNAIEAMKDSGGEFTVKSELQDGQLQFSVSDTGVGLPAEKMDQIFSAFFATKPQGSGMGLAISRSIVESHGGQLWARPTVEGAQLLISLYRSRSRSHRPWLPRFFSWAYSALACR